MTHTYVFEGVMTAMTSISHIGESRGITSLLRREAIVQPDGTVEAVPIISGNSLRGQLRDLGMQHMLRYLGYGVNEETGEVAGLSLAAFYFLFSGGSLTKSAGKGLDIDEAREWRQMIPLVALFGGAMGNQIMPGKIKIGKAVPICRETAHLVPERFVTGKEQSIWDMLQQEAYTRKDDEKNETLRKLIAPDVRALLEDKARGERKVRGTTKEVATEPGEKQQMRYFIETLAAGTKLFWDVVLDDVSELEFEAFCVTLAEFARQPYIGGKSGTGMGKVAVQFDEWIEINPRLAPEGRAMDFALGQRYEAHLKTHGAEIKERLNGLS